MLKLNHFSFTALVTAVLDEFASVLHQKYAREIVAAVVCFLCFLFGLPMVTEVTDLLSNDISGKCSEYINNLCSFLFQGGIYVFQIFDYYACSGIVLFAFCLSEICAISYGYGIEKWCCNVESMIGRKVNPFLKFTWTISCPCICLVKLLFYPYIFRYFQVHVFLRSTRACS